MKALRKSLIWYVLLAPTYLTFAVFLVYPVLESLRLSFFYTHGTRETEVWVGLANYGRIVGHPTWWNAVFNTFYMGIIGLLIGIPLGLVLASLINLCPWGKTLFKVTYFIPQVTSIIAVSIVFQYLLNPDRGFINYALRSAGIASPPLWLNSPDTSKLAVILLGIWHGVGYTMLICLAGLQAIGADLYEAAEIDGADRLQQWWYVTIPNLRHTFIFLIMTGTIGAMARFADVWLFGGPSGSPARSLQTIVLYIYEWGFGSFEFGVASAAAYLLFAITIILTLINFRLFIWPETREERLG